MTLLSNLSKRASVISESSRNPSALQYESSPPSLLLIIPSRSNPQIQGSIDTPSCLTPQRDYWKLAKFIQDNNHTSTISHIFSSAFQPSKISALNDSLSDRLKPSLVRGKSVRSGGDSALTGRDRAGDDQFLCGNDLWSLTDSSVRFFYRDFSCFQSQ